jgi:hypothetical protein
MRWMTRHPRLTAWFVLAAGMLIFLFIEARDIGLTATNWIALIVATTLVAGLCVWIVSWEDNNEADQPVVTTPVEPVDAVIIDPAGETEVNASMTMTTDDPEQTQ